MTVLNGHIHQTMQKVEGNVDLSHRDVHRVSAAAAGHSARARPDESSRRATARRARHHAGALSGTSCASRHRGSDTIWNSPAAALALGEEAARASAARTKPNDGSATEQAGNIAIGIDNFSFTPKVARLAAGRTVTWTNRDDVPHRIQSTTGRFPPSAVLDTKGEYAVRLTEPGVYAYFCSLHPTMTGTIIVA